MIIIWIINFKAFNNVSYISNIKLIDSYINNFKDDVTSCSDTDSQHVYSNRTVYSDSTATPSNSTQSYTFPTPASSIQMALVDFLIAELLNHNQPEEIIPVSSIDKKGVTDLIFPVERALGHLNILEAESMLTPDLLTSDMLISEVDCLEMFEGCNPKNNGNELASNYSSAECSSEEPPFQKSSSRSTSSPKASCSRRSSTCSGFSEASSYKSPSSSYKSPSSSSQHASSSFRRVSASSQSASGSSWHASSSSRGTSSSALHVSCSSDRPSSSSSSTELVSATYSIKGLESPQNMENQTNISLDIDSFLAIPESLAVAKSGVKVLTLYLSCLSI